MTPNNTTPDHPTTPPTPHNPHHKHHQTTPKHHEHPKNTQTPQHTTPTPPPTTHAHTTHLDKVHPPVGEGHFERFRVSRDWISVRRLMWVLAVAHAVVQWSVGLHLYVVSGRWFPLGLVCGVLPLVAVWWQEQRSVRVSSESEGV